MSPFCNSVGSIIILYSTNLYVEFILFVSVTASDFNASIFSVITVPFGISIVATIVLSAFESPVLPVLPVPELWLFDCLLSPLGTIVDAKSFFPALAVNLSSFFSNNDATFLPAVAFKLSGVTILSVGIDVTTPSITKSSGLTSLFALISLAAT